MAIAPGQADPRNLLELATDIHTDLGKLATGLAHAGAQPQAVQSLQRMGEIIAEVVKLLGSGSLGGAGQHGEAAVPGEAASAAAPPQAAPPQAAPPEAAAAAGPPQGPRPGERPNGFHAAAAGLQARLATAHAAAQRELQGATQ